MKMKASDWAKGDPRAVKSDTSTSGSRVWNCVAPDTEARGDCFTLVLQCYFVFGMQCVRGRAARRLRCGLNVRPRVKAARKRFGSNCYVTHFHDWPVCVGFAVFFVFSKCASIFLCLFVFSAEPMSKHMRWGALTWGSK